jgi:hypothetical protein
MFLVARSTQDQTPTDLSQDLLHFSIYGAANLPNGPPEPKIEPHEQFGRRFVMLV